MNDSTSWTGVVLTVIFIGIALGCTYWFALYVRVHYFRRELSQEQRTAAYVGAKPLPREPIQIVVKNRRDSEIQIDKAEIDGSDLFVYYTNISGSEVPYVKITWKGISPDGTVVTTGYGHPNYGTALDAGQKAEYKYQYFEADPRISKLEVAAQSNW